MLLEWVMEMRASGDGWKFRGRGALQLTGKANYEAFAKYLGHNEVLENPDLVATKYALNQLCSSLKETSYGLFAIKVSTTLLF
jgi:predicted chitinase